MISISDPCLSRQAGSPGKRMARPKAASKAGYLPRPVGGENRITNWDCERTRRAFTAGQLRLSRYHGAPGSCGEGVSAANSARFSKMWQEQEKTNGESRDR